MMGQVPTVQKVEGMQDVFRHGRVFVTGQPTEQDFRTFKAQGVTLAVNLRQASEMQTLPMNQASQEALIRELGMTYLWLPLREESSFEPSVVARLAEAMKAHPGPVLIYCATARRSSLLYVAYLVREGMAMPQAMDIGRHMKFDSSMNGLLERLLRADTKP
ncbi:MAG: hypothetical protein LWX11_06395 [Firmicutes bacterium]|nr:hypothetical protein [Bacillota bacterium]